MKTEALSFFFLPQTLFLKAILFCGLMPPTLALTFLLREKSAKAYPRGGVLLDISSGGSIPHSHFVTLPLIYHETAVISLGKSAKPKKSFILIKNKPLCIALLFAKV